MIKADLCRREVNKRVGRIVRMFKWGVENEFVPAMIHHALSQVRGLARGRSPARESEPVRPVFDAHVDAVKPFVGRQVWAMIRVQRLTGMRPGEVCIMRASDIDQSGANWIYRPGSHKTEHHGHERKVFLDPKVQDVLKPWLRPDRPDAFLFSPQDELAERSATRRASRKTRVQPSHRRANGSEQRRPRSCQSPCRCRRSGRRSCRRFPPGLDAHARQNRRNSLPVAARRGKLADISVLLGDANQPAACLSPKKGSAINRRSRYSSVRHSLIPCRFERPARRPGRDCWP